MDPESQKILDKAYDNCQKLHTCNRMLELVKKIANVLNSVREKEIVNKMNLDGYTSQIEKFRKTISEKQQSLKNENDQLKLKYNNAYHSFKNQSYRLPGEEEISIYDLFDCKIDKIPPKKKSSDANNSSATSKKQPVPADANSPKSKTINSSKSEKPAVPATKNPLSPLKPNVPQKPLTKNSGKKVTFGINNTQPSVTKNPQVNNNKNAARNEQASSATFNQNKELIKSVMGKMNRQTNDFQSSSGFEPIVNSRKNMFQTLEELYFEANMLDDNIIISEMTKITNIIDNMHTIVKMRKGKLEEIYQTNDTEGLLSRQDDITKNLDYLQKKYHFLLVYGDNDILDKDMPSDFVSGESNWNEIKKRYIELKHLEKKLNEVNSKISNKICACRQDTEKLVNKQLEEQLKPVVDIYSNRAKAMDNNSMFGIKVLTFIKKLNFKNLDFGERFNEMVSSVKDNHIKKYANNSKVTYNDDYLINFQKKYPKNIHDDSNTDRNTVSKMPSNLNSLSLSSKAVSFQKPKKKQTDNVAGKLKPAAPASSGSPKNVSEPVDAGSTPKNKNKDASATKTSAQQQKKNVTSKLKSASPGSSKKDSTKSSDSVDAGSIKHQKKKHKAAQGSVPESTHTDKSHEKSPTNASVNVSEVGSKKHSVRSDSVSTKNPEKDNKALDSSDPISWSTLKSSKTLDELIEKVNGYSLTSPFSPVVSDSLLKIKSLKGLAEKIMEQYYEKFDNLYTNPDEKRYIKLEMQINNIQNKYKDFVSIGTDWGYSDLKSIPKPSNFTGTNEDWDNFKSNYEKLNNEYETLSSGLYSKMNELYSKKQKLDEETKSTLKSEVISKLEKIKSDLDRMKSELQNDDQKKIVKSIIGYVGSLIKKYSDFSRNVSKTFSIKNDPTKTMWKYQKRGAGEGFTPELGD